METSRNFVGRSDGSAEVTTADPIIRGHLAWNYVSWRSMRAIIGGVISRVTKFRLGSTS